MNRQELAQKIDTSFDFTTEEYWDGFWENPKNGISGLGTCKDGRDPDGRSSDLADVHTFLWSRKTGNKQNPDTELKLEKNYDSSYYLKDKNSGIDFSSDTLVNGYRWKRLTDLDLGNSVSGNGVIPALIRDYGQAQYRAIQERFTHKAYTVGGMIIFPRRSASINSARGNNPNISDRVDLTVEWIRRFFFKEKTDISDVLEKNKDFFDLFGQGKDGFKAYIDFFFLNDLVSADYERVYSFFGPNDFSRQNAYPGTTQEWRQWHALAIEFIDARNDRIKKALTEGILWE